MPICKQEHIADYVLSKRGGDGGYLSYHYMDMFESSAEDTYYALATLKTLESTYYAVKSLELLGEL